MATIDLPQPTALARSTSERVRSNAKELKFGDGYSQYHTYGLNPMVEEWNVKWIPLPMTDARAVETLLRGQNGVEPIAWTPPGDTAQKKYVASNIKFGIEGYNHGVVSVTLKQIFTV